jgi:hypothetical protein
VRISTSLALSVALIFALACERTSAPLTIAGPTIVATAVNISIVGERQFMVGQAASLRAMAEMSDGSLRDVTRAAKWHSSNTAVCVAENGGIVVASNAGICDVSASFEAITTTASFAVVDWAWTGEIISVDVQGPRTLSAGNGDLYTVMANMPDESQLDITSNASFSSSDPSVADIDRDGRIAALSEGSTTITVVAYGLQVAFRVTVLPPLDAPVFTH